MYVCCVHTVYVSVFTRNMCLCKCSFCCVIKECLWYAVYSYKIHVSCETTPAYHIHTCLGTVCSSGRPLTFLGSLKSEVLETSVFSGLALCEGGVHLLVFPNPLWCRVPIPAKLDRLGEVIVRFIVQSVLLSVVVLTGPTIASNGG